MYFAILLLVGVDQLFKQLFYLFGYEYLIFDGMVGFTLHLNSGVAFGIPVPQFLSIFFSILFLFVFYFSRDRIFRRNHISDAVVVLIFSGAIGNLIDRLFIGQVVDFIKMFSWPVFNLADSYLVTGFLIMLVFWKRIERGGKT